MEETKLNADLATMLVKKLGKNYRRQVTVRAVQMDFPFTYNDIKGDRGDYLILDEEGGVIVMSPASFKQLCGTARRGRKKKTLTVGTLPPLACPVSNGESLPTHQSLMASFEPEPEI